MTITVTDTQTDTKLTVTAVQAELVCREATVTVTEQLALFPVDVEAVQP